jgi:hypothetical protein
VSPAEGSAVRLAEAGTAGPRGWDLLDKRASSAVPYVFVVICAVLGTCYVVPPLQAPDESVHLIRAYGVPQGHLVGPASSSVPKTIDELIRL